ncbi:RNA-directed DNA polymerase (Reverse transcriptase) [Gossypium australe]|uniref:RNA-directed DNA polymerase (Reverse transcriptase) n=1 Tax=Gossypium australe TaxID=47621 RepID=A0A5B6V129_9ROSI|nr:RNA-directed DNA polymerase (Reverse transcriptase) [Gossypium australe]
MGRADRPFRFLTSWLMHPKFKDVVVKSGIAPLERRGTTRLQKKEAVVRTKIENILEQEKMLWFQKSRSEWLSNGDRNTIFFHSRTMKRQKQNKIEALMIDNIGRCYDEETLKKHAIDYFTKLYYVEQYTIGDFPDRGCFPKISSQSLRVLREEVLIEEIRHSLFNTALLKALGIDGFHDMVWSTVYEMVRNVFLGGQLDPCINRTLIVLIPKRFGAKLIKQYRPISLCIVLYKVITKTIDIRLRQMMQTLEAIHTMKHTKGKQKWMAVKVDFKKAYDRVKCDFLKDTLYEVGLPTPLNRIIMSCVSTSLM